MEAKLNLQAMARAGAYAGLILYGLCILFYLVVYRGSGEWMLQPFMPGTAPSARGFLLGLVWAIGYGAGLPWLIAALYNRALGSTARRQPV